MNQEIVDRNTDYYANRSPYFRFSHAHFPVFVYVVPQKSTLKQTQ